MLLLKRIEALRASLRDAAASDEVFEEVYDDSYFDALGTAAKQVVAGGMVMALPSIRVAEPTGLASLAFRWPLPSSGMVELESDRTGKIACAEYRVVLDENSVMRHSDYRITKVMDAFIKDDPEKMLLAARAHTLARRIPDLRLDAAGAVSGPTDPEWAERAFAGFGIPTDNPELMTFRPLLAKFWYAWCQSWLGLQQGPGRAGSCASCMTSWVVNSSRTTPSSRAT